MIKHQTLIFSENPLAVVWYLLAAVRLLIPNQENIVCSLHNENKYSFFPPLLQPIQFEPCQCPLLAVDGIAYGCQQLIGTAPRAGLQRVVEQGQRLQLQLLGLAHLLHRALLPTPREKLPVSSVVASR